MQQPEITPNLPFHKFLKGELRPPLVYERTIMHRFGIFLNATNRGRNSKYRRETHTYIANGDSPPGIMVKDDQQSITS